MTSLGNDMIYENMGTCKYLNAETQPASDMLRSCIGKSSEQIAPCHKFNHKLHMRVLDRPQDNTYFTQNTQKKEELKGPHKVLVEGLANYDPGEFTIMAGECPESYLKDAYGGCTKVCKNCKVNNGGKSFEFNEFDPCFPNGVYDGIDNYGNLKCTCGKNNQYCSDNKSLYDMFTTDGNMVYNGGKYPVNQNRNIFSNNPGFLPGEVHDGLTHNVIKGHCHRNGNNGHKCHDHEENDHLLKKGDDGYWDPEGQLYGGMHWLGKD